ncbi:MAG: polysaccharide biosynthesis/export family protein [Burkholderiaceae bacterium]
MKLPRASWLASCLVLLSLAGGLPAHAITAIAALPTFGQQLFTGQFKAQSATGFNAGYQIQQGDRIVLRLWGAITSEGTLTVDPQGNIFVPNVGPVTVRGVRNGDLNKRVERAIKSVYRTNVQVYASLEAAQPVKVYVTGFVSKPGLYGGLSSDSVLNYLDQAGGVDADRGSFISVMVKRGGQIRQQVDLYEFLMSGEMPQVQLADGDTLVVAPRQHTIAVHGEVANEYRFEFAKPHMPLLEVLAFARPAPNATHISIIRGRGARRQSEYIPITQAHLVSVGDGDQVRVTADRFAGTILVRLDGAHSGEHGVVLPYGATLQDAIARLKPNRLSDMDNLQVFRKSVAERQKEMLDVALKKLETQALTARSATNEEARLRVSEAELVLKFTQRARAVNPKGQLVLANMDTAADTVLEDGDLIVVPERSSQVMIHGEVMFPIALQHQRGLSAKDYIGQAGGFGQNADTSRILLMARNGLVTEVEGEATLNPGDELMVLPRTQTKSIEVTRGITQIIYQIAVAARVALGL